LSCWQKSHSECGEQNKKRCSHNLALHNFPPFRVLGVGCSV
jgi:hypothetical protein